MKTQAEIIEWLTDPDDEGMRADIAEILAGQSALIERLKGTQGYGLTVLVCSLFDALDSSQAALGTALMSRMRVHVEAFREAVRADIAAAKGSEPDRIIEARR